MLKQNNSTRRFCKEYLADWVQAVASVVMIVILLQRNRVCWVNWNQSANNNQCVDILGKKGKKLLPTKILYRTRRVSDGSGTVQPLAFYLKEKLTLVRPRSASYRFLLLLPMRKSLTRYHRRDMRPLRSLLNIYQPDLRCGLKVAKIEP